MKTTSHYSPSMPWNWEIYRLCQILSHRCGIWIHIVGGNTWSGRIHLTVYNSSSAMIRNQLRRVGLVPNQRIGGIQSSVIEQGAMEASTKDRRVGMPGYAVSSNADFIEPERHRLLMHYARCGLTIWERFGRDIALGLSNLAESMSDGVRQLRHVAFLSEG